jgi:nitroimidazol reductase NimA-like FMN-containing flavoprotein (pyridoxamine 5'-phosphate oxidase superfamily)
MPDPVHVFEDLDEAECRRLLATAPIGRLGFTEGALPMIVPVHFVVRGDDVVICTLDGPKVRSAGRNDVVAFEVDSYDPDTREGWGVVVVGVTRLITDEADLAGLDALGFAPWSRQQGRHYFAVRMDSVRGRILTRAEQPADLERALPR